jgi:hypothetical protein
MLIFCPELCGRDFSTILLFILLILSYSRTAMPKAWMNYDEFRLNASTKRLLSVKMFPISSYFLLLFLAPDDFH